MSFLCCVFALLAPISFLPADEPDPIEAGRQALQESADYPWYDAEADDLRDLNAKEKAAEDSDTRKHGWEVETPQLNTTAAPNWKFPTLWEIVQFMAMGLLVALIIGLVYLLIRYFLKQEEDLGSPGAAFEAERSEGEVDRVEQLPFVVRRPGGDLLSEARTLYEQGRFGEAIVYLYSYQLVQLDRNHLIHLSKGKTNRQYLREVREQPTLRGILHQTMIAFEDVFFGHHELDRERFEQCWRRLDEFHAALEQGALV